MTTLESSSFIFRLRHVSMKNNSMGILSCFNYMIKLLIKIASSANVNLPKTLGYTIYG